MSGVRRLLALSGGGARGALQVSVCERVTAYERWGTSVGAINAAGAAYDPSILRPIWEAIRSAKDFQAFQLDAYNGAFHLRPMRRLLLESGALSFTGRVKVGAVHLASGKHRLVDITRKSKRGRLAWITASATQPGIHERWKINGRWWGDGGIRHPLPNTYAQWAKFGEIHAVFCTPPHLPLPTLEEKDVSSGLEQAARGIDLLVHARVRADYERLKRWKRQQPDIRIFAYHPRDWTNVGPTFAATPEWIERRLEEGAWMARNPTEL